MEKSAVSPTIIVLYKITFPTCNFQNKPLIKLFTMGIKGPGTV